MEYTEISDSMKYKTNPFKGEIEESLQVYRKKASVASQRYTADNSSSYIPFMQLTEAGIDSGLRMARGCVQEKQISTNKERKKGSGSGTFFLYFMVMKRVFAEGRDPDTGKGTDKITLNLGIINATCYDLNIDPPPSAHISRSMKELYRQRILAKTTFGNGIFWINTAKLFNGIRS